MHYHYVTAPYTAALAETAYTLDVVAATTNQVPFSGYQQGDRVTLGMPRSDLTAQRSITFVDDLHNARVDITHVERAIGFPDEYIILRIQTTALEGLAVGVCKRDFFLFHRHAPFKFGELPVRTMAQNPDGLGECGLSRRQTIQGEDLTVAFAMEAEAGFEPGSFRCAHERATCSASLP